MFKTIITVALLLLLVQQTNAQAPKGLTIAEYDKAKTFVIKDLDNDTYVKFDNNTYVLDRYEGKKPYFITGDDGLKKRIDLYTLLLKADTKELGTLIYYTNEKGKLYTVCLPNVAADKAVWEKYFEDIHAIDKVETNFVLKLSYVLSKEYSYQTYKSSLKGKEIDRAEAGTYGNDICFPGDEAITLSNGQQKALKEIQPGDEIVTADPLTQQQSVVKVKQLITHDAKNYAITHLLLMAATDNETTSGHQVQLHTRELEATPNHPVMTNRGVIHIGAIKEGQLMMCLNNNTGKYEPYKVWDVTEKANGIQPVFNIETASGSTLVVNGVLVMQK